jgi:hypothetical protein
LAPTPLAPLSAAVLVTAFLLTVTPASASNWKPPLRTGSTGEAQAQVKPSAPSGVSAACVSSSQQKVSVSWSTVAHATGYAIYESTTSASSGYSSVATGQTGTSWTSGTLSAANYWFEVAANVGTNWASTNSAATGESTISTSKCTQP